MKVLRAPGSLRRYRRQVSGPVVLVPTMGALHRGHLALIRRGRKLAARGGTLVVSIFVNPTQFGPSEDYAAYPRPLARDLGLCREAGVDAVFGPSAETMYAADASVRVVETRLSTILCGASRPGHFNGVCTVVAKLFNLVRPDAAVFGCKDWQQLVVVRRMARDLDFPVRVIGHPTVRDRDGLALSSRNAYLNLEQRAAAPGIFAALREARAAVRHGEDSVAEVRRALLRDLRRIPGAAVDYAEVLTRDSLLPLKKINVPVTMAVAVRLGRARLVDNIQAVPPKKK